MPQKVARPSEEDEKEGRRADRLIQLMLAPDITVIFEQFSEKDHDELKDTLAERLTEGEESVRLSNGAVISLDLLASNLTVMAEKKRVKNLTIEDLMEILGAGTKPPHYLTAEQIEAYLQEVEGGSSEGEGAEAA